ncbi:hypothetical protein AMTRI_Chr09g38910 [Amborella trichopoda]
MFGFIGCICKNPRLSSASFQLRTLKTHGTSLLFKLSPPVTKNIRLSDISFGPLNLFIQKRWKKPVITAQMRLEDRTRDLKLDKLMRSLKRLKIVLRIQELMMSRRDRYVSVQLLSKWRRKVGLNIGIGIFLRKYPHIFEIYTHPLKRTLCCRLTQMMLSLIEEEKRVIRETEFMAVERLKKLLMVSINGTLHVHAISLISRELGLPENFRDSIFLKYPEDFSLVNLEIVKLVKRDESLAVAEVEKWREREYREKWLSEFETRYAFPFNYPTGFKIVKGARERMKTWQRLNYLMPYERKEVVRAHTCGGVDRFKKRAVGILHEFLSITVEKMVEVERLSHFRKDFGMEINLRELLLKHPGIFYISTRGNIQNVFLRDSYSKGCLIEPNPVYTVRRKILDLLLMGFRNTKKMGSQEERNMVSQEAGRDPSNGEWVIPILESLHNEESDPSLSGVSCSSSDDDDGEECDWDDAYINQAERLATHK